MSPNQYLTNNRLLELCVKVAKALKDSGAAIAEYQQLVLELQGLQTVFMSLAALEPTESNISHVNAIRRTALASTLPLQEFLSKLERFDNSMSPFSKKTLGRAGRQVQYAVIMTEEVKKIRAMIYGNVISINVRLATHASESLSRTESRLSINQQDLVKKFEETRNEMANIIKNIAATREDINKSQEETRQEMARSMTL